MNDGFSGTEHFRSKDYEISAEMFEKSMLYVPHDEDNRARRSNCFRVLSLCHLALMQLDQAEEFINEADKVYVFNKNSGEHQLEAITVNSGTTSDPWVLPCPAA